MKIGKLFCTGAAALMLISIGTLSSCKKDNQQEQQMQIEANQALPTNDQLEVTTPLKAVVLGSNRSNYNASVVNRLKNVSGELCDDAEVVVFTTGYAMNFTKNQVRSLILSYIKGANLIFVNPTFPATDDFEKNYEGALTDIVAENADFDTDAAGDFLKTVENVKEIFVNKLCGEVECVACRENSIYVVKSLEVMADSSSNNAVGFFSDNKQNSGESSCVDDNYVPTDYDHGKSADLLLGWMNNPESKSIRKFDAADFGVKSDASADIEKFMTGYRVSIQHSVGPSRALDRTLRYEMVYTFYSAYDFNKQEDYYFIRLEPNFHCSALGCRNGDRNWVNANKVVRFDDGSTSGEFWSSKTDMWYGPYMSKFNYSARLVKANGFAVNNSTLLATSPHTDVSGSVGYSTGISYSLSGNFGFNSNGPTGGVSGGVSFSESHSHTEPSLKVYHSIDSNIPTWRIEGISPKCHVGFFSYYHDEVATFQKNDWQSEFTWVVKVPKLGDGEPYYLMAEDMAEVTELNYNIYDLELRVHPTQSTKLKLCEPSRCNDSFTMSCDNQSLQNKIKEQFPLLWENQFIYYALNSKESEEGAKNMFEKVKAAVSGFSENLKQQYYTGTYKFTLRKTDGTLVSEFTLENGEVK